MFSFSFLFRYDFICLIANYLYNNRWLRFSNAISFKDVNEADIDSVEKYIKFDALRDVQNQLEQTFDAGDGDCDFLLDEEQLIEVYGPRYASNPSEFRFELGDKKMIRELVAHVKEIVDVNGKMKGLGHFEMKKKRNTKQLLSTTTKTVKNQRATTKNDENIETLRAKLFKRYENYLKGLDVDISELSDDMVVVEPNLVVGKIHCIFCKGEKKKSPPKSVYYHRGIKSCFWTISNYTSHCVNAHPNFISNQNQNVTPVKRNAKTKVDKTKNKKNNTKEKKRRICDSCDSDDAHNVLLPKKIKEKKVCHNKTDQSLEAVVIESETETDMAIENNNEISIYDQFSSQITKMIGFVLMNGDTQEKMYFQLTNDVKRCLYVVCTNPNGNCLFSALAHQLFGDPIESNEHLKKTNNLRAAVVAHILIPEYFPMFQHELEDRVFEIIKKKKSEIGDLVEECKKYVSDFLSNSGHWGGLETIKAVSNMYKTNVAVFNEQGSCYIIKSNDTTFTKTLMIAYRCYENEFGVKVYNHYDSITDMESDSIIASANSLPLKSNK